MRVLDCQQLLLHAQDDAHAHAFGRDFSILGASASKNTLLGAGFARMTGRAKGHVRLRFCARSTHFVTFTIDQVPSRKVTGPGTHSVEDRSHK